SFAPHAKSRDAFLRVCGAPVTLSPPGGRTCAVVSCALFPVQRAGRMKARIQWAGEAMFLGESGSGHVVVMDGPPESGGRNLGVRPMEMLLLGLGGCSSFDVVSILRKSRQAVESCEAFLQAERAEEDPKVFTRIHL